ncbi:MAG TPA: STAS domain-containing protein [Solirubrobacterales bacterium]|nr:STAS domain-containing protein [Solirubrobacterales bacterium]
MESSVCGRGEEFVELRLVGEADRGSAPSLRHQLERASGGDRHLLLDLRACEFIDSSALAAILFTCRELEQKGQRLLCYGGGTQVRRIFEISGLLGGVLGPEERGEALAQLLGPAKAP